MTKVIILKNAKNQYKGFRCDGHADYAEAGHDIVCAAISMLVINTINSIDSLTDNQLNVKTAENDGRIECQFPGSLDAKGILLMDSLILGLKGVISEYGTRYCEMTIKEV